MDKSTQLIILSMDLNLIPELLYLWLHIQSTNTITLLKVEAKAMNLQQMQEVNLLANCYDLGWY